MLQSLEAGIHVVVDAFWGSSGKGKVSTALADRFAVKHVSAANYPNAGHTFRRGEHKRVFKVLPTAAALGGRVCWIAGDSGIVPEQLRTEVKENPLNDIKIHGRAVRVTDDHKRAEHEAKGLRTIASTMQGGMAALSEKIARRSGLQPFGTSFDWTTLSPELFRQQLFRAASVSPVLHEVSQGTALSVNFGTHYPECTSRDCLTASAFEDLGQPVHLCREVFLNVRTFPIRVGNLVENTRQVGYSGDFCSDGPETTWLGVARDAGMPESEIPAMLEIETTTVTKRQRRVSLMSDSWLRASAEMNGATRLSITFIEYVDWEMRGRRGEGRELLTRKARMFVERCEAVTQTPAALVSTGPDHDDVIWL